MEDNNSGKTRCYRRYMRITGVALVWPC